MESLAQTLTRKLFSHLITCDTCREDMSNFPQFIHQAEINYDNAQIMSNKKIMSRRLQLIRRAIARVHVNNPVKW